MKRPQFSLATLLIIPLVFSPLMLSIREILNLATNRGRQWGAEIAILAVAYPLALTLFSFVRRTTISSVSPMRLGLSGAVRGAIYGVVYFMLLLVPLAIAEQIIIYPGFDVIARVTAFAKILGSGIVLGAYFGVVVGCAAGLGIGWIAANRNSHLSP